MDVLLTFEEYNVYNVVDWSYVLTCSLATSSGCISSRWILEGLNIFVQGYFTILLLPLSAQPLFPFLLYFFPHPFTFSRFFSEGLFPKFSWGVLLWSLGLR